MILRPPRSTRTDTLFPYTTLFLSRADTLLASIRIGKILDSSLRSIFGLNHLLVLSLGLANAIDTAEQCFPRVARSEEHTSDLQSLMRFSYAALSLNNHNSRQRTLAKQTDTTTHKPTTPQRRENS